MIRGCTGSVTLGRKVLARDAKEMALITKRPLEPVLLLNKGYSWLWTNTVETEEEVYSNILNAKSEELVNMIENIKEYIVNAENLSNMKDVMKMIEEYPYITLDEKALKQFPDEDLFRVYFFNKIYMPIMVKGIHDVLAGLVDIMKVSGWMAILEGDKRSESILIAAREVLFDLGLSIVTMCPRGTPKRMPEEAINVIKAVFYGEKPSLHSCSLTAFLANRKNEQLAGAIYDYIKENNLYDLKVLADGLNELNWGVIGITLKEAYDLALDYLKDLDTTSFGINAFTKSLLSYINVIKDESMEELLTLVMDGLTNKENVNEEVFIRGVTLAPYYTIQGIIDLDPLITASNWNGLYRLALLEIKKAQG